MTDRHFDIRSFTLERHSLQSFCLEEPKIISSPKIESIGIEKEKSVNARGADKRGEENPDDV